MIGECENYAKNYECVVGRLCVNVDAFVCLHGLTSGKSTLLARHQCVSVIICGVSGKKTIRTAPLSGRRIGASGSLSLETAKGEIRQAMSSTEERNSIDVGQLLDIKWKLGLAVSSDECRNLNFPFVTMTLKTSDASGQEHLRTVEMTLTQFRNLSRQLQEMAKCMETV